MMYALAGTVLLPALSWFAGVAMKRGCRDSGVIPANPDEGVSKEIQTASTSTSLGSTFTSLDFVRLAVAAVCLPASLSSLAGAFGLDGFDPAAILTLGLAGPVPIPVNAACAISLTGLIMAMSAGGIAGAAMALVHTAGILAGGSRAAGVSLLLLVILFFICKIGNMRLSKVAWPLSGSFHTTLATLLGIFGILGIWLGRADFSRAIPPDFVALDLDKPSFEAKELSTAGGGTISARSRKASVDFITAFLRPTAGTAEISGVAFNLPGNTGRRSARVTAFLGDRMVMEGEFCGCTGTSDSVMRLGLFLPPTVANIVRIDFFPVHRTDLFEISDLRLLGESISLANGNGIGDVSAVASTDSGFSGTGVAASLRPGRFRFRAGSIDRLIGRFRAQIFRLVREVSSASGLSWKLIGTHGGGIGFFGVGPGKSSEFFHDYRWVFKSEGMPVPRHAHNLILQFWLELGWGGVAAAMVLLLFALDAVRRAVSEPSDSFTAGALALAFIVMNLLDFVLLTKSCAAIMLFSLGYEFSFLPPLKNFLSTDSRSGVPIS